MRALLGLLGAAVTLVVIVPSAAARDGNAVTGRAIFVRDNCYSCHGTFGEGGMGPNLREDRPNDDDIRRAVLRGTPTGMPAFRGLLNNRDVQNLIAYIRSLRDNDEPRSTHWWEFIRSRFPDQSRCCDVPNEPPHTTP